ncbi:helix-turn-helix domain-containing protein [Litorivivens sp.]|uniref:helix-turn-helix domain-containing protein n=1 Tax=Litorivivens sp. TaxID=2020868 RepID=UPI0035655CBF
MADNGTTDDKQRWAGETAISPGLGIFRGHSGDNRPHRHWAHQISIGLDREVVFDIEGKEVCAPAVLIAAGTRHRQHNGETLSLYIDPLVNVDIPVTLDTKQSKWKALADNEAQVLVSRFPREKSLQDTLQQIALPEPLTLVDNQRLAAVIAKIQASTQGNNNISRDELAALCRLSPSRFSHWFSEQTGLPLRSYRKWLRLITALEIALTTTNLSQAATEAGFSDQAHFTRAVREAFGISPTQLMKLLA